MPLMGRAPPTTFRLFITLFMPSTFSISVDASTFADSSVQSYGSMMNA
jgi:hypothetical protein